MARKSACLQSESILGFKKAGRTGRGLAMNPRKTGRGRIRGTTGAGQAPETTPLSLADVLVARQRIQRFVHHTPVESSQTFNRLIGAEVFFKLENQQRIGAFKARGAHNAVFSLSDADAKRGVVTHSSGNHAAALSLAARNRGIPAHIVMPTHAPAPKIASVERLGGKITFCEPTLAAREAVAAKIQAATGAVLVHPYNDRAVIAGQGTAALEFLEDIAGLQVLVAPVGGGGLLSGTALVARSQIVPVEVHGAEPAAADDAYRSLEAGRIMPIAPTAATTIADGLRTSLCELTFGILQTQVSSIVTVSEASIVTAMRLVWEVMKVVIEPSAAVPVAALLEGKLDVRGRKVGVILSGGNVDLERLPWMTTAR